MTTFLSGELKMYEAYNNGKDLYAMIAQSAFDNNYEDNLEFWPEGTELDIDGQKIIAGKKTHKNPAGKERRSVGKVLNLAATYGMGGGTAGARLGKSKEEGQKLLNNFFTGFPKVKEAIDQSKQFLIDNGYVEDFVGRRRRLNDIYLPKYEVVLKSNPEVSDTNFNPILGCANRIIKDAKIIKWEKIVQEKIEASQRFQRERAFAEGRPWTPNGEMSNTQYEKLAKEALKDGVIIKANTGRIAQATRQCFNARIQGCLSCDTKIFTKQFGLVSIGAISNKYIDVWDGKAWSKAEVLPSGKKQKCILTTGIGTKIVCSPDHKFYIMNTAGKSSFKKLAELKPQDRLIINQTIPQQKTATKLRDLLVQDYTTCYNKNNYSFDDISDSYIRGQILGRIASDGSYGLKQKEHTGYIHILVAEHEKELLEYFRTNLPYHITESCLQKKNQKVYRLTLSSTTLAQECLYLDIKHQIHKYFYSDIDCLRGFISGFFDGDGTANNEHLQLDFGTQADFTSLCSQMQAALLLFNIRSTVSKFKDRFRVNIRKADAITFANNIGFITANKQTKAEHMMVLKDNHCFRGEKITTIRSIEFTDELIDMYDVCNTERGYFVADGFITHNSAASLTKMAMVDIFNDEQLKQWDAKLIITVHDEVLVECPEIYADLVEKRLPEIMIAAAKKAGDDVPQACDPYNVTRWYADEAAAALQDEFKTLESGDKKKGIAPKAKEEALQILYNRHCELSQNTILKTIETGCDLEF